MMNYVLSIILAFVIGVFFGSWLMMLGDFEDEEDKQ